MAEVARRAEERAAKRQAEAEAERRRRAAVRAQSVNSLCGAFICLSPRSCITCAAAAVACSAVLCRAVAVQEPRVQAAVRGSAGLGGHAAQSLNRSSAGSAPGCSMFRVHSALFY